VSGHLEWSELNWSWSDYLITAYIGRRGNTFSVRQDAETRGFKGLEAMSWTVFVGHGFSRDVQELETHGLYPLTP
jgi:hypothetical protein